MADQRSHAYERLADEPAEAASSESKTPPTNTKPAPPRPMLGNVASYTRTSAYFDAIEQLKDEEVLAAPPQRERRERRNSSAKRLLHQDSDVLSVLQTRKNNPKDCATKVCKEMTPVSLNATKVMRK